MAAGAPAAHSTRPSRTYPRPGTFKLSKASKLRVRTLRAAVPEIAFPPNTTITPAAASSQATRTASNRLRLPSVPGSPMGSCEPVSTTGFGLACTKYDNPAAVYASVSVP